MKEKISEDTMTQEDPKCRYQYLLRDCYRQELSIRDMHQPESGTFLILSQRRGYSRRRLQEIAQTAGFSPEVTDALHREVHGRVCRERVSVRSDETMEKLEYLLDLFKPAGGQP